MNKQLTPQEIGRRKKMDNQIFKFGILTIAVLFIISLMFSNLTDAERESDSGTIATDNTNIAQSTKKSESTNVSEPTPRKEEPRDYSEIDYKLPRTDYLYKVKIVDFQTVLVKDAFTMKAGEYAIPTKENGYLLSIKYTMLNPYSTEMMAPVPIDYWISSSGGQFFSSSTFGSRYCNCEIDSQTALTTEDGVDLSKLSEERCGNFDYCVKFKPNETKTFIVKFDNPIYWKVKELMFHSFGLESQGTHFTVKTYVPLIIDVEKKTVIGERNF